jgi:hypothetical protein
MATSVTTEPHPIRVSWTAAIWAGIVSGAVFLVLEMILVPTVLGMSPWGAVRMMAAIIMGRGVLAPPEQPATFDLTVTIAAMVVHFALSIMYAIVLAFVIRRMSVGPAVVVGAIYGLALYAINFYGFTAVFPWFAMARNWVSIVTHLVFGATAAWAYVGIARKRASFATV